MKPRLRKWTLRIITTGLLLAGLLLIIVLNPMLLYAGKTTSGPLSIYHNDSADALFTVRVQQAAGLLRQSELYDSAFRIDVCPNDGSAYPGIVALVRPPAFAWGFYNKVVLQGEANARDNYVALNGYRWNLTQLLAHEAVHCLQYHRLGLLHAPPIGRMAHWKLEGYPEYVARRNDDQRLLSSNIGRLLKAAQADNNGWIQFADSTGTVIPYYKAWLLMQYCMDVRKMSYAQVIKDTAGEESIRRQMMAWYAAQKAPVSAE